MKVIEVYADKAFVGCMIEHLKDFYTHFFREAPVESHLTTKGL